MLSEDLENKLIVPNFSANHSEALCKTKQAMRGKKVTGDLRCSVYRYCDCFSTKVAIWGSHF